MAGCKNVETWPCCAPTLFTQGLTPVPPAGGPLTASLKRRPIAAYNASLRAVKAKRARTGGQARDLGS